MAVWQKKSNLELPSAESSRKFLEQFDKANFKELVHGDLRQHNLESSSWAVCGLGLVGDNNYVPAVKAFEKAAKIEPNLKTKINFLECAQHAAILANNERKAASIAISLSKLRRQ